MCYLKIFQTQSAIQPSKCITFDDTDSCFSEEASFMTIKDELSFQIKNPINNTNQHSKSQMLLNILSMLKYNSALIDSLQNKISYNFQSLDKLNFEQDCESIQINEFKQINTRNSFISEEIQKNEYYSEQDLTQKMFGKKSYKYKLNLVQIIPQIIYKQRNLSFEISLTTIDGKVIRNSNIINLCLGVCDTNGEWISQTKNGENFMKGKTETELYHGESNFCKIYPRDVSRYYQDGKINFVIYPKPSILNYSGNNSSLECNVSYEQIEPLLIKDLTIRAKKKQ